jgi:DNA-damage-inducible protein D
MSKDTLSVPTLIAFEQLKRLNAFDAEFWSARDLQPVLGYAQWRRFEDAIKRAITSCEASGNQSSDHFASAGKMVGLGSGSEREVEDFQLSRFACYLIAQNSDPRKPAIANAQKYFAVQTRRQELSDQIASDVERIGLRKQTKEEFKQLSGAARTAGVQDRKFGIFHDAGYKGLYGGMGVDAIRAHKDIPQQESILDRMDATELAANQFRMTQTRDKLARDRVRSERGAIATHETVGREVRNAIREIGGTPPENIAPVEHIKLVEKRLKSATPKLVLDGPEATGLRGDTE